MLLVSKITSIILAVIIMMILIGAFIGSYLLNKKTPKPEGCENLSEECEGCQIVSCSHRKEKIEEEEI